jgi:ubiquinone/menaquinone biosynthesis C-methylase UbiE
MHRSSAVAEARRYDSAVGIYARFVLPRLVHVVCGSERMARLRRDLVPRADGRVLEVGVGSGHNVPYYDPSRVEVVIGLDPSVGLLAMAERRVAKAAVAVDLVEASAEAIPLDDGSVDTIVMTWSLCSIGNPGAAAVEMRRVLRKGGRLLFCEHGLAPDARVRAWQLRLTPAWRLVSGGCRLDVDPPARLREAGFEVGVEEAAYVSSIRPASFVYRGTAC